MSSLAPPQRTPRRRSTGVSSPRWAERCSGFAAASVACGLAPLGVARVGAVIAATAILSLTLRPHQQTSN